MERLRPLLVGAAVLALLAGCDTIFTTNLFSFARRDPSNMSLAQRINYAEEALASGDPAVIKDAYDAIKDDAAASTDGDLQLLAGQLALELSGISDTFSELTNIDFGAPLAANIAYINDLVAALSATYVTDAANFYQQAAGSGGGLDATDYLMGALAILADATADPAQGAGDVSALASTDPGILDAIALLSAAQAALRPDDPSIQIIADFTSFLGPTNFP